MRIGASHAPSRARRPALAVVLGGFLGGLDTYIVNLALPRVAADLGVGLSAVGWVLLAYLLATGGLVVVVGRLRHELPHPPHSGTPRATRRRSCPSNASSFAIAASCAWPGCSACCC